MTRLSTLREFMSSPREVHVVVYGLLVGLFLHRVADEIRHEPQYFGVALIIGHEIRRHLRGDA